MTKNSSLATTLLLLLSLAACGSDGPVNPPIVVPGTPTPPTVVSTSPVRDATAVPLNANLSVTFSEAMDPSTMTAATLILKAGAIAATGVVTYDGLIASFSPGSALAADTLYTATVTTGAKDLASEALASPHEWTFRTGATADTAAPTVLSANPGDGSLAVPITRSLVVTFSEAMNPTTLTTSSFTVAGPGSSPVSGEVTYAGTQATFRPLSSLAANTEFRATVGTGARDLAGNPLAVDFVWSFTTSASTRLGPAPVLLGQAADYVILAKSGVDTVPTSAVNGNIGVSPIDSTAVTGFSLTVDASNQFATSSQITGQVRAADYSSPTASNLTTAVSNMETAYTDAAGRPTPDFIELGTGEIGGMTLVPGLYKWSTGVAISTDVTFAGGADDVWIFQISGDVTLANGVRIHLSGGALPKNIFWQAFGQLNIGTTAHFEGVALIYTAVVVGTGASVNGRLLAQTAVTLDANAVTQPAQ